MLAFHICSAHITGKKQNRKGRWVNDRDVVYTVYLVSSSVWTVYLEWQAFLCCFPRIKNKSQDYVKANLARWGMKRYCSADLHYTKFLVATTAMPAHFSVLPALSHPHQLRKGWFI